jgi:hypothetical protein
MYLFFIRKLASGCALKGAARGVVALMPDRKVILSYRQKIALHEGRH